MNKAPNLFRLSNLQYIINSETQVNLKGRMKEIGYVDAWAPARPVGFFSITHRLRCAYLVFTGKADVVIWPEDEMEN